MKNHNGEPFVIKYVKFDYTRLVDHKEKFHERIHIAGAKKLAQEANLDLVCFSEPDKDSLALCKIIDFGKWKYTNDKNKRKEEKQHKKVTKEIRFTPVISDHDIEHKIKQVNEFLSMGDDVILSMRLKGRQKQHFNEAEGRMNQIVEMCNEHGKEVSRKKSSGMIVVRICSHKKEEK